jgi:hypothetical protein
MTLLITRVERTRTFNELIKEEWQQKFYNFIETCSHKISYCGLSLNENVTMDYIRANPDKPWNWFGISRNPNLTTEFIDENPDKMWDWDEIAGHANVTMDYIKANPDKPWFGGYYYLYTYVSYNPNLTVEFIKANPDIKWNWQAISEHIKLEEIDSNPDMPWNMYFVFKNQHITGKYIRENSHKKWVSDMLDWVAQVYEPEPEQWDCNKERENMTLAEIEQFISKFKKTTQNLMIHISRNVNLNIDFIKRYINTHMRWHWGELSKNSRVSLGDISTNLELPWDWPEISSRPDITLDFINDNIEKSWNWQTLSNNPNLTLDFVVKNIDKHWDWYKISNHSFESEKHAHIISEYRRMLAVYRIQQWWHRIRMDPRHPVGIRRLEREYTELFGQEAP